MSWNKFLDKEKDKEYYIELFNTLDNLYNTKVIYPKKQDIFNAFDLCELDDLKVVIIGQDPYHGINQANGLAFSVHKDIKLPKSLVNMFKELKDDLNIENRHGDLSTWAKQGVLLINTVLTVEQGLAGSHYNIGWEQFFSNLLVFINEIDRPLVYILLGNNALKYKSFITNTKHSIVSAPHPSPLSAYRGFFNSKIYSKTNELLVSNGLVEIDWKLSEE